MSEWWEDFFGGLWQQAQLGMWTDEDNRAAADKIEQALGLSSPTDVLDVPCGAGRISLELADRGHQVTGVDLNEAFLAEASRKSIERGLSIRWERSDMRELAFAAEFEVALSFWGSFGYFDDAGNRRTAESAHRSLAPGGRYLIDVPVVETIFPDFAERMWFEADETLVLQENRFDHVSGRSETDWTVIAPDGRRERRHSSMRLYSYHELAELLLGTGFSRVEGFDPEGLGPFGFAASRLWMVATK